MLNLFPFPFSEVKNNIEQCLALFACVTVFLLRPEIVLVLSLLSSMEQKHRALNLGKMVWWTDTNIYLLITAWSHRKEFLSLDES